MGVRTNTPLKVAYVNPVDETGKASEKVVKSEPVMHTEIKYVF